MLVIEDTVKALERLLAFERPIEVRKLLMGSPHAITTLLRVLVIHCCVIRVMRIFFRVTCGTAVTFYNISFFKL